MKKLAHLTLAIVVLCTNILAHANNSEKRTFNENINRLEINGLSAKLQKGNENSVEVVGITNFVDIISKVDNNTLYLRLKSSSDFSTKDIYAIVTLKDVNNIQLTNMASIESDNVLDFSNLQITATNTSKVDLKLNATQLDLRVDNLSSADIHNIGENVQVRQMGMSKVFLSGRNDFITAGVSGMSKFDFSKSETKKANININGNSKAIVGSSKTTEIDLEGMSTFELHANNKIEKFSEPGVYNIEVDNNNLNIDFQGIGRQKSSKQQSDNDIDVYVDGSEPAEIEEDSKEQYAIINDEDGVRVTLKNKTVYINDDGISVNKKPKKQRSFVGNWQGFGMGVNTVFVPENNLLYSPSVVYFDSDIYLPKSISVDINLYQKSIGLYKDKFGIVTGVGLTYNNYRFDDNARIDFNSQGYPFFNEQDSAKNYLKSKLTNFYITVPLLFEYQIRTPNRSNNFHINAGVVGMMLANSHTKYVYREDNKSNKTKVKNSTYKYINPLRADATVGIGWNNINIYARYALNDLFKNKYVYGPNTPFSVGIMLTDLF